MYLQATASPCKIKRNLHPLHPSLDEKKTLEKTVYFRCKAQSSHPHLGPRWCPQTSLHCLQCKCRQGPVSASFISFHHPTDAMPPMGIQYKLLLQPSMISWSSKHNRTCRAQDLKVHIILNLSESDSSRLFMHFYAVLCSFTMFRHVLSWTSLRQFSRSALVGGCSTQRAGLLGRFLHRIHQVIAHVAQDLGFPRFQHVNVRWNDEIRVRCGETCETSCNPTMSTLCPTMSYNQKSQLWTRILAELHIKIVVCILCQMPSLQAMTALHRQARRRHRQDSSLSPWTNVDRLDRLDRRLGLAKTNLDKRQTWTNLDKLSNVSNLSEALWEFWDTWRCRSKPSMPVFLASSTSNSTSSAGVSSSTGGT